MSDVIFPTRKNLKILSPVTALALSATANIIAGSDDGTVRCYDAKSLKVTKAVRISSKNEISSIIYSPRADVELGDVWVACGQQAMLFPLDSPKTILSVDDASVVLKLCDDDDVLNELSLSSSGQLAFSSDLGMVGVVQAGTHAITRMKTRHNSVCGNVKFIPDRPQELVSGGYDSCCLHFNLALGTLLSRRDIPSSGAGSETGMSMSPPFVTSMAISSLGTLAVGLADGRLWLAFGGEKRSNVKKKTRKWDGLSAHDASTIHKLADGPIVALAFCDADTLVFSTLLGIVTKYKFAWDTKSETVLVLLWKAATTLVRKVNALVYRDDRLVVGGLDVDSKGTIEVWDLNVRS